MKRSKLVVFLMLLSLAFSWFVSVGVVSAENPWDADSPGAPGSSDTSAAPSSDIHSGGTGTTGDGFDAFHDWLVQIVFMVYLQTIGQTNVSIDQSDDGGKSQNTTTSARK